ncbi:MAG: hypothetical protein OXE94_05775 [Aestuariivita sp.]|nr:hypothetical protein [Aestuariivita sp.]
MQGFSYPNVIATPPGLVQDGTAGIPTATDGVRNWKKGLPLPVHGEPLNAAALHQLSEGGYRELAAERVLLYLDNYPGWMPSHCWSCRFD